MLRTASPWPLARRDATATTTTPPAVSCRRRRSASQPASQPRSNPRTKAGGKRNKRDEAPGRFLTRGKGTIISIGSRNAAFDIQYTKCVFGGEDRTAAAAAAENAPGCGGGGGWKGCVELLPPAVGNVDTGILEGDGAVDKASLMRHDGVRRTLERVRASRKVSPKVVTNACVVLVVNEKVAAAEWEMCVDLDQDIDRISEVGKQDAAQPMQKDLSIG